MGGESAFGKGLPEIILCLATTGRQDKGFGPACAAIDASFDLDPVRDMALPAGNAINDLLQSMASGGSELRIPPACLLDMQGEPLEYGEGVSLSVRFPVLARNANPLRHMQGGYLMATLDNPLVPFSYLIAPPSVASALNTRHLRPVTAETAYIVCMARLSERTCDTLHLLGKHAIPTARCWRCAQATFQILATKGGQGAFFFELPAFPASPAPHQLLTHLPRAPTRRSGCPQAHAGEIALPDLQYALEAGAEVGLRVFDHRAIHAHRAFPELARGLAITGSDAGGGQQCGDAQPFGRHADVLQRQQ